MSSFVKREEKRKKRSHQIQTTTSWTWQAGSWDLKKVNCNNLLDWGRKIS
jgi:hypothetical protein